MGEHPRARCLYASIVQTVPASFWSVKLSPRLPNARLGMHFATGNRKNNPWERGLRGHSQPSHFRGDAQTLRRACFRSEPLWPIRARIRNNVGNSVGSTSASLAKGPQPIGQGGQVYTHTHGQAIGQSHSWAHAKAVRRTRSKMGIGSTAAWPGPRLPAWQSKVWSTAGSTVPQPGPRLGVQQSSQPHANAIAKQSGQAYGWVQSKAVGPTAGSTAKWPRPLS